MLRRMIVPGGLAAAMALSLVTLSLVSLTAQGPAPESPVTRSTYTPPRTPWGDPDLQGIWPSTDLVGVPFERPAQFGNRQFLKRGDRWLVGTVDEVAGRIEGLRALGVTRVLLQHLNHDDDAMLALVGDRLLPQLR